MIDIKKEQLLSLNEATETLPRRNDGQKVSLASIYRWSLHGCAGTILETVQVGGARCTSREALERFVAACSARPSSRGRKRKTVVSTKTRAPRRRSKRPDQSGQQLDAAGIR